jgi:hypothetical protein
MDEPITVSLANRTSQEVNCNFDEGERHLVIRGIFNMRNNSWKLCDEMALIDTILKGLPCPPIYIFRDQNHPLDHVFDGAHRLETSCGFVSNKLMINEVATPAMVWETSPLKNYIGKYFRNLSPEDKTKIANYKFLFHVLDPTLAENPEELAALWVRLNNSGSKLNAYEMYKPIYHVFYDLLETESQSWLGTQLNPNTPSPKPGSKKKQMPKRGEPEEKLMKLLALSEPAAPTSFQSYVDLYKKWRIATFGKTSDVRANFEAKKADLDARLKHLRIVYEFLEEKTVIVHNQNDVILLAFIGRIARWCQTRSMLTRCGSRFTEYANMMFDPAYDIPSTLGCSGTGGSYQKRLVMRVDRDIQDIVDQLDDPRRFTPTQMSLKLKEQGRVCPECEKPIKWGQKYEGHHVIPYSKAGPTTMENLQVLHTECHAALHARS